MEIYVTFGAGHIHNVDGKLLNQNTIAVISGEDWVSCRQKAFDLFGPKFCTDYNKEEIKQIEHYFPRGYVKV